jgi:hypothetical protein
MTEPLPLTLLDDLSGPETGLQARLDQAGAAHPTAATILEPVADVLIDASIDLVLTMQRRDALLVSRGKLGPYGCVFATQEAPGAEAGWWQAATVGGAPRLVARATNLGPRGGQDHSGRLIPMPREALEVACGRGEPQAPTAALIDAMVADGHPRRALEAILSPEALFWSLQLFAAGAATSSTSLAVIDTERHGLWLVLEAPGGAILQSATPTGVWRALCHTLAVLPPTV